MPTPDRAKPVFLAALGRPDPADRAAFLDAECGGDADLRRRVEGLLAADAATDFLDRPAAAPAPAAAAAAAGTLLAGRYRLGEPLGEGGMGTVWRAEQLAPVRRPVAVKLVKAGLDSAGVLRRFEAERQALAVMDHPHIARVFDAGTGPDGRPFFAMELVEGQPITAYCDARRLTPRQRLELFVPVCQAVQHAHQKGVIHRDLKPSNVLVTEVDGRPVPKVIDFGVAKAVERPLDADTLGTAVGTVVGTPEYMAPEQASLDADVDTRADVYALGVVLYELLTGSTPVDRKALGRAALLEVLRVVREVDPPRPSAKLSTSDALPSLAAVRNTDPRALTGLLRTELDWVVMKALAKDRGRRYDTAAGFAADVLRYLGGEPVQAVPPSRGYRLRTFARRNRGPVLAAGLVVAALAAGLAGTGLGLVEARRQRDAADAARVEAETRQAEAEAARAAEADQRRQAEAATARAAERAAESDAMVGFIEDNVFAAARPRGQEGGLGRDVTLRQAVTASLPALAGRFKDQPLVEGRLRQALSVTLRYLGDAPAALDQQQRARAIFLERCGPDHWNTITSTQTLANTYAALNRHADALPLRREGLAAARRVLPPDSPRLVGVLINLAATLTALKQHAEAIRLGEEAVALARRAYGPDHPNTLGVSNNLAIGYRDVGRPADAARLGQEVLAAYRRTLGPDHPNALASAGVVADCLGDLGRHAEALDLHRAALAGKQRALGPDHPRTVEQYWGVADSLLRLGRGAEAVPLIDECVRRAAGRPVIPTLVPGVVGLRREVFEAAADPDGVRATAVLWEGLNRPDGDSLVRAAAHRAAAAALFARAGRPAEARADADRAMGWLHKAVAAGLRDRNRLATDPAFAALRDRADFRAVLAALPESAPPPRPAP